jgi:hypothetical protein
MDRKSGLWDAESKDAESKMECVCAQQSARDGFIMHVENEDDKTSRDSGAGYSEMEMIAMSFSRRQTPRCRNQRGETGAAYEFTTVRCGHYLSGIVWTHCCKICEMIP